MLSLVDALDELLRRFTQTNSHVRRPYKCPACYGWHFTSKRSRFESPDSPPPLREGWYAVISDGKKVWQSKDEVEAHKAALKFRDATVEMMEVRRNGR